jgi:hypothetical protein
MTSEELQEFLSNGRIKNETERSELTMTSEELQEFLSIRKEAGLKIDPAT